MATGQYDDAWETPGWTAQNMAYPPDDTLIIPGFPADVDLVTVVGRFGADGWFEIDNGNIALEHPGTKEWIQPIRHRVEIRNRIFRVVVPATDATTLSADGSWGYHMRISVAGRLFKEGWDIPLLRATPVVNVYDIAFQSTPPEALPDGGGVDGGSPVSVFPLDGGTP